MYVDKRVLFLFVFCFTFFTTVLVALVCFWTEQRILDGILFTLASMWISGIVSQLLLQNLYLGIVRPLEEARLEEKLAKRKFLVNIDDIETISEVEDMSEQGKKI